MAITLTGSEGLFTRLGRFGDLYLNTVTNVGSALDVAVEDIRDEFETGADASVIDGIYAARNAFRTTPTGFLQQLQTMMQNTVVEQVNRDTPLLSKTLSNALLELIRQMKANGDDVLRPTISATTTAWGSNLGDATFVTSLKNEYGDPTDMVFAEDITLRCTSDSSTGATQYREVFSVSGEPTLAVSDVNWPGGSGTSTSITLFDAGSQNDLITNGGFDTWSNAASAPDSWTIGTGTAGTTIERDSSTIKRGAYACRFDSDGSTLLAIKQQLSTTLVKPNRVLLLNLWAKVDTLDASGIVRFRLCDGAGTTLTDDAGNSQAYTRNTNGNIAATWTNISTAFQTPRQLPSTGVYLEIAFTTSPANLRTVSFDLVGLVEGQRLYAAGPYTRGFSAASANAIGDYSTLAIANNAPNAGWVRAGQRWLGLPSFGQQYYFPSVTSSESVADSLLA